MILHGLMHRIIHTNTWLKSLNIRKGPLRYVMPTSIRGKERSKSAELPIKTSETFSVPRAFIKIESGR